MHVCQQPKSASHESTGHKWGPLSWKFMASPFSSFQVPLDTPSLSQTSLPPQSLLKWRNLANDNRCCPSPFMYPVWTSLSSFCEYIAYPLSLQEYLFVLPNSMIHDKEETLLKHIFLHHPQMSESPQMFESLQMLQLQYVPNKYSLNGELLLSDLSHCHWICVILYYSKEISSPTLAGSNNFLLPVFFSPSTQILWRLNFKLLWKNLH